MPARDEKSAAPLAIKVPAGEPSVRRCEIFPRRLRWRGLIFQPRLDGQNPRNGALGWGL
jgi:hypothetical protein